MDHFIGQREVLEALEVGGFSTSLNFTFMGISWFPIWRLCDASAYPNFLTKRLSSCRLIGHARCFRHQPRGLIAFVKCPSMRASGSLIFGSSIRRRAHLKPFVSKGTGGAY